MFKSIDSPGKEWTRTSSGHIYAFFNADLANECTSGGLKVHASWLGTQSLASHESLSVSLLTLKPPPPRKLFAHSILRGLAWVNGSKEYCASSCGQLSRVGTSSESLICRLKICVIAYVVGLGNSWNYHYQCSV